MKKKITAILLVAVMAITMALSASADTLARDRCVKVENGKYVVIQMNDADMYNGDTGIFQWGLSACMSIEDGALKITPTVERTQLTVTQAWPKTYGISTTDYPYIAFYYKCAADCPFIVLQDTDTTPDFPQQFAFTLGAASDYKIAVVKVPTELRTSTAMEFIRLDVVGNTSEVFIKDIGFFKTVADVAAYYKTKEIAGVRDYVKTAPGKYVNIKTSPAATVFDADGSSAGTCFKWSFGTNLEACDGGVKVKANSASELTVGYGDMGTLGIQDIVDTFIPKTTKYFVIRYKTAQKANLGVKFMIPGDTENWDSWSDPKYSVMFDVPASDDYTIAYVELPSDMQFEAAPRLVGWECASAPADIFVTDIGFFSSVAEAKDYFGIVDPAVDTADGTLAVSAAVAVISILGTGIVLGKKKH